MLSNAIGSVQRFSTRSVRSLRYLLYPNRLRDLGLVTLKFHRLREDLISLYKNFNGKAGMKEAQTGKREDLKPLVLGTPGERLAVLLWAV